MTNDEMDDLVEEWHDDPGVNLDAPLITFLMSRTGFSYEHIIHWIETAEVPMSWHYELICDSCNFRRNKITMETDDEANEHEQSTADHWVQMVKITDKDTNSQ